MPQDLLSDDPATIVSPTNGFRNSNCSESEHPPHAAHPQAHRYDATEFVEPETHADDFEIAIADSDSYPQNLKKHRAHRHNAVAYAQRLIDQEAALCVVPGRGNVKFSDYDDQSQKFRGETCKDLRALDKYLSHRRDPKCRFVFISARDSRSPLNISMDMLKRLLTHHEVSPAILDFLFGFGKRHFAQRFPFGGFRAERRLADATMGSNLKRLGRSGRAVWMCYNLRSVESYPKKNDWPWSIRQTAVYHSFDVITGRATWIVLKANNVMEHRVKLEIKSRERTTMTSFGTNSRSLTASLEAHLTFVEWTAENWGWYIDFLTEEIEDVTKRYAKASLQAPLQLPPCEPTSRIKPPSRSLSNLSIGSLKRFVHRVDTREASANYDEEKTNFDPISSISNNTPAGNLDPPTETSIAAEAHLRLIAFQKSQDLEEKATETMQILDTCLSVLGSLAKFYKDTLQSLDCPEEYKVDCRAPLERFVFRVECVCDELGVQRLRAKSLLRHLSERKALLNQMIDYYNLQAGRLLAEKSNRSAVSVEQMTADMHKIAQKTKQETVSMRIITLVTLFFLPGTFISTLMSTDIIRWRSEDDTVFQRTISTDAIEFFLSITLPLMAGTFFAWYVVYRWTSARECRDGYSS